METLKTLKPLKESKLPIKLTQNYFAVQNPIYGDIKSGKTKGGLELPEEAKAKYFDDLVRDSSKKMEKLEIVAVGPECKTIKSGNFVYMDLNKALNPHVIRYTIGNKDDEIQFLIYREQEIIGIYE